MRNSVTFRVVELTGLCLRSIWKIGLHFESVWLT